MSGPAWFVAGVFATLVIEIGGVAVGTFIDRSSRLRDQGGPR